MTQILSPNDVQMVAGGKRGTGANRLKIFSGLFPFLLVPVIVYNLLALFSDAVGPDGTPAIRTALESAAFRIPMLSDVTMHLAWGDLMVVFSVVFLFIEVIKSTSTGSMGIANHVFSMLLFVLCLMEFLMFASFATGTFFIITALVLLDALAGMIVTIVSARRDFGVEGAL